ncbi:MAG: DUF3450 domain-containing protein [Pseudomonadales bacterium]|nr:DUF3450 domain-containing protein [Pseudomonadales bacterium]
MRKPLFSTSIFLSIILSFSLFITNMAYANSLDKVLIEGAKGSDTARQSQKKIDKLSSDTAILLQKYQSANAEIDYLIPHNKQIEGQISGQEISLKDLRNAINEVQAIERQLGPLLIKMVDRLTNFIEIDKPFLLEERRQRITYLRKSLNSHDLSISDKFRQVMDAYEIEMEYGNTLDTYNDTVNIGGQDLEVNILKVGRIAIVFQTADELTSGYWNEDLKQWELLPGSYRRSIRQGIRLTRNQATTELLLTPIMLDSMTQNGRGEK